MQELRHLNVALNNITSFQNVQRCESLERLDLTANFVPKSSLGSVSCLAHNIHFRELHLLGNPCAEWECYRPYVIATLPLLQKLVSSTMQKQLTSVFVADYSSERADALGARTVCPSGQMSGSMHKSCCQACRRA